MVIDLILNRRDGELYGDAYHPCKFYREVTEYGFDYIARAMDCGEEIDVKKALCRYIDEEGYNPNVKRYINRVNWLEEGYC